MCFLAPHSLYHSCYVARTWPRFYNQEEEPMPQPLLPLAEASDFFVFLHVSKAGGTSFFKQAESFLGLTHCMPQHSSRLYKPIIEHAVREAKAFRCNLLHRENSRQSVLKSFARQMEGSGRNIRFVTFLRSPLVHFASQIAWRVPELNRLGVDGIIEKGAIY